MSTFREIERMLANPYLASHPAIQEAQRVHALTTKLREVYVMAGLALEAGDYRTAAECAADAHEISLEIHDGAHEIKETILEVMNAQRDQEKVDARVTETLSWIEEERPRDA